MALSRYDNGTIIYHKYVDGDGVLDLAIYYNSTAGEICRYTGVFKKYTTCTHSPINKMPLTDFPYPLGMQRICDSIEMNKTTLLE